MTQPKTQPTKPSQPSVGALRAAKRVTNLVRSAPTYGCKENENIDNTVANIIDRETGVAALLAVAKEVWTLIENGSLVRNVSHDVEPDWALKQLPLIKTLTRLEQAIAKCEGGE